MKKNEKIDENVYISDLSVFLTKNEKKMGWGFFCQTKDIISIPYNCLVPST